MLRVRCNRTEPEERHFHIETVRPIDPDTGYASLNDLCDPCDRFLCRPHGPLLDHVHVSKSMLHDMQSARFLERLQTMQKYHANMALWVRARSLADVKLDSPVDHKLTLRNIAPMESSMNLTAASWRRRTRGSPRRPVLFNIMDSEDLLNLNKQRFVTGIFGDDPYWAPPEKPCITWRMNQQPEKALHKKVTLPRPFDFAKRDECFTRIKHLCELERIEFNEVLPRVRVSIPNYKILHKNREWQMARRVIAPVTVVKPFRFAERDERRHLKLAKKPLVPTQSLLERITKATLNPKYAKQVWLFK